MSYKCRTERITPYRAILNEGGFEKGDVESIVDRWYDINGNIYKSVENCIGLYYIREYTLYDEQGRPASIIRKNDKGDFESSAIFFRYDEAGHITKKLFYYNDGQMLDEDETEEEEAIRGNDNLKLEGWEEYQYNADFSSATVLMFELDEPPQLVFKRIESYDSDGELVESVTHYCGDSNRPRHIYVSKDESGNKIVTTESVTVKNNWPTAENLEYENFKGRISRVLGLQPDSNTKIDFVIQICGFIIYSMWILLFNSELIRFAHKIFSKGICQVQNYIAVVC